MKRHNSRSYGSPEALDQSRRQLHLTTAQTIGQKPPLSPQMTPSPSPPKFLLNRWRKQRKNLVISVGVCSLFFGFTVVLWFSSSASTPFPATVTGDFYNTTTASLPLFFPTIPPTVVALTKDQLLKKWNRPPIIHIIHTRFMQEQGGLVALARARLALFQIVCLPTIVHQSTQHFLWLIQVDPLLDGMVLRALLQLVSPYPNIFVIPSNVNFRINQEFPGAWRDGAEIHSVQQHGFYDGGSSNVEFLVLAMALEPHLPIVETRLDADDGLQLNFLQAVQEDALHQLEDTNIRWMYWCSRRHIEWHWSLHGSPTGRLDGITHDHLCVTPGLTVGFAKGTSEASVPVFPHHEVAKMLLGDYRRSCGSKDCLQWVKDTAFAAVRSRTPTSAGMADVLLGDEDAEDDEPWVQYVMWNALHEMFRLERPPLEWMNTYLKQHLTEIATDNLLGQCTTGHSCKESAQADLQRIIELQEESELEKRT